MIWIIIWLILSLVLSIIVCRNEWNDIEDKIVYSTLASVASAVGIAMAFLVVSVSVTACAEIKYNMSSDTEIIALKDNQNINGSYYIMGGYVNEDLYYYYATETEFGYKTEKIKADNVYIKYTDDNPHIEKHEPEFANDYVKQFAGCMATSRYIIYCPEGTMTTEFNIDLE